MRGLDTLTHTQYDYRNLRCACAPRVNYSLEMRTIIIQCLLELSYIVCDNNETKVRSPNDMRMYTK